MARQRVEVRAGREGQEAVVPGGFVMRDLLVGMGDVLRGRWPFLGKILTTAIVVLIALLHWDAGAAFFLTLLTASLVGLVNRRVSVALGLFSLAGCPLLLIADREAWLQRSSIVNYYAANVGLYNAAVAADTLAVWAYYFLCIGVAAQIVHYLIRR